MKTIATLRTFKRHNFTVQIRAVEDWDMDLSFDESGEILEKLNAGELICFGVIVTVYGNGIELGEDSLWGCIYETPQEFMDHVGIRERSRKDGKNYASYVTGMVSGAIKEARKMLLTLNRLPIRSTAAVCA